MAKRNKAKFASKGRKSALRVEALEQRQLLAVVTGGGTEVGSNIQHQNGNVYDQVKMTGSSVTVTADAGQVTRVSFLDLSGDIVQAEFSGKGSLTISLDQFSGLQDATNYNQPGVQYVKGLASFTIQGEDSTTNFNVFSVGSSTAVNQDLFAGGKTGGNNVVDIARILIVADPTNPGGFSTMGSIRAGNAIFSDTSGVVGISGTNVNVQGSVVVRDIDATNAGVPTLAFGSGSQFATLTVAGGDLVQTNASKINGLGFTNVNSVNGTTSAGTTVTSKLVSAAAFNDVDAVTPGVNFTNGGPALTSVTLDTSTAIDLTGKTQAEITAFFSGRTFTSALTVSGDLSSTSSIAAAEFRGGVTFTGDIAGTVTTTGGASSLAAKNVTGAVTIGGALGNVTLSGNLTNTIAAKSIGNVSIGGALSLTGLLTTDLDGDNAFTTGEGAIGNVAITGNIANTAAIEGVLGIGNVTVGGNITSTGAAAGGVQTGVFVTASGASGDSFLGNIGTVTVTGDVDQGDSPANLINIRNNGNFGNVTINGGGTTGKTDNSDFVSVGSIRVGTSLGLTTAVTGNISITEATNDVEFKGLSVAGSAGSVGTLSITGPTAVKTDLKFGGVSAAGIATGALTVTGFNDVYVNGAINAKTLGNVSITTATGTATDASSIVLEAAIGGVDSQGNVTLNAGGAGSLVDLSGASNASTVLGLGTAVGAISGAKIGDITLTAASISVDAVGVIKATDTAGTITFNGATTITGAAAVDLQKATTAVAINGTSTITGAAAIKLGGVLGSLTTTDATTLAAASTITLKGVTNAISLTGLTVGAAGAITDAGSAGSLVLNPIASGTNAGLAADLSAAAGTVFTFDNVGTGRDTVGSISINGRISGWVGGNDIVASSIGDVTITGKLTQDQILVQNLDIIARPNGGATDKAEKVATDGSDLGNYGIGNISVSSQLDLAYTGTRLFAGDNTFVGLGKIGNVTLTGAASGAQQTALFNANTDAAWFVAGDTDGLANTTAALPINSILSTATTPSGIGDTVGILTGGTITIGNVQVNARQTTIAGGYSGVDAINGSASTGFEGLAVLSGVRARNAAGAAGDVLSMAAAGSTVVNMDKIDADVKGTIGSILITSNNAVGFRDSVAGTVTAGTGVVSTLAGTATELYAGIVAATSTGGIQGGAAIAASDTDHVVIIGDANATTDDTVEAVGAGGQDQIVVVVL